MHTLTIYGKEYEVEDDVSDFIIMISKERDELRVEDRRKPTTWILWQRACDMMRAEILKELRHHHELNVVTSHKDVDALICDVHHPVMTRADVGT